MVHVDVPKVRGKMAEKGYNTTSLSEALGISRNTMTVYLRTPEKMPYSIISKMAGLLCETDQDAANIFFASDFRETQENADEC